MFCEAIGPSKRCYPSTVPSRRKASDESLAAWCDQWLIMSLSRKISSLAATAALVVGLVYGMIQLKAMKDQIGVTVFTTYTQRYMDLMAKLPASAYDTLAKNKPSQPIQRRRTECHSNLLRFVVRRVLPSHPRACGSQGLETVGEWHPIPHEGGGLPGWMEENLRSCVRAVRHGLRPASKRVYGRESSSRRQGGLVKSCDDTDL